MKDIPLILNNLGNNPQIFRQLIEGIPAGLQKERRLSDHWTIHESAAHLASTQEMLIARFEKIQKKEQAFIKAHLPDFSKTNEGLLALDLEECLNDFAQKRTRMLGFLKNYTTQNWQKEARHEECQPFNAYLLLRHVLLVDNVHFFNIERLWLTRENYLK